MNYSDLLELVKARRSIRRFKSEPVSDELVEKIIEVARWAPSGNNSQPWEFVVVKKPELREKIASRIRADYAATYASGRELQRSPELRFSWTPHGYMSAQVFIILCGDMRMREAWAAGAKPERVNQAINSSLSCAFVYMTLAVTSLGLGAQWVSSIAVPEIEKFTKELLGVPEELKFFALLAVGYSDVTPAPRLVRPLSEIIKYDDCGGNQFRTSEQVKDFIARHHRDRAEEFKITYGNQPHIT